MKQNLFFYIADNPIVEPNVCNFELHTWNDKVVENCTIIGLRNFNNENDEDYQDTPVCDKCLETILESFVLVEDDET